MKVDILASRADRSGGADVYTSELASRLALRGHDVTVYCHTAGERARAEYRVVIVDRGASAGYPALWRFAPVLQLWSVYDSIRRHHARTPEVVIGMAHQVLWAHERYFGPVPMVYLPHSLIAPVEVASYGWPSSVQRRCAVAVWQSLERRALTRAYSTIRFNQTACDALKAYYGSRVASRFSVIPPGVDVPPARDDVGQSAVVRLLTVGRLVETKNLDFLMRTLKDIEGLWQLDVVGDGPERAALERCVREYGLIERVTFHGHVADPSPFYRRADLLVAPSRLESAMLVLLEAMAAGVPTLTIRADGVRYLNANHEFVSSGEDGFIADDEQDFRVRLASLVKDPSPLRQAGERARCRVLRNHTWDAHLSAFEALLNEARRAA